MSLDVYRALHVFGLIMLMLGFGGSLLAPAESRSRLAVVLHGIGALVMLVAGFGSMAKLGFMAPGTWPGWLLVKMGIWLLLAAMPVLVRRGIVPRPLAWFMVLLLGAGAAWLGTTKMLFG